MASSSSSSSSCCFFFSASHDHAFTRRFLTTTRSINLRRIAASPKIRARLVFSVSCAASPLAADDEEKQEHEEEVYGFQMEVSKMEGKRNRRMVRARVDIEAPLEAVWETLTDYEGLADFIPGLSECRLLHKDHRFARLYQVGEQDLALGFKFNAKGTIDCFEGELELMPATGATRRRRRRRRRRREIAFNMIDGDFKFFQGKWSVQEVDTSSINQQDREISEDQEFQTTTLSYLVELEPKLWVPVRLLEGRICNEIKTNLVYIREQAQKICRLQHE